MSHDEVGIFDPELHVVGRSGSLLDVEVMAFVVGDAGRVGSSYLTLNGKSRQKIEFLAIAEIALVVEESK